MGDISSTMHSINSISIMIPKDNNENKELKREPNALVTRIDITYYPDYTDSMKQRKIRVDVNGNVTDITDQEKTLIRIRKINWEIIAVFSLVGMIGLFSIYIFAVLVNIWASLITNLTWMIIIIGMLIINLNNKDDDKEKED